MFNEDNFCPWVSDDEIMDAIAMEEDNHQDYMTEAQYLADQEALAWASRACNMISSDNRYVPNDLPF